MAKIDLIYEAVDDFGLITSAEAADLGMSRAEMVQQEKLGKLVRVARGVYRMPIWPSQPQAPYAIAVKAAGEDAFLYGESVVALLGLGPNRSHEDTTGVPETLPTRFGARCDHEARDGNTPRAPRRNCVPAHPGCHQCRSADYGALACWQSPAQSPRGRLHHAR